MDVNALEKFDIEPFLRKSENQVVVIIDNQQDLPSQETTILDMTDDNTKIVRRGLGIERVEEVFDRQREPLEK